VPVFDGLDLEIQAGHSLAIVGQNGAGKTTLVKLLCRMYDPDRGRITVDDVDLRDLDVDEWRARLAVIFQDFVRYEATLADNIGIGVDRERNGMPVEMAEALHLAGGDGIVAALPRGWETILSRSYEDGADLSGGQWQKVALARALLRSRHGGVLVLDEPTANLDVRAEAELFDRFLEITRRDRTDAGLTTLLISHRFSTVRRAERICVLEAGRVVEDGTHERLIHEGGHYAEMFNLQAHRFVESTATEGGEE
jgi:ATP-binding cassette subfamily B protein